MSGIFVLLVFWGFGHFGWTFWRQPLRGSGSPSPPPPLPFRRSAQLFARPHICKLTHHTTQHRSCVLCRRRKIRCNRETPCSNCTKSKNATCVYRDPPRAPRPPPHSGRRQGAFGDTSQPTNARLAPGLAPGPASAPAPDLAGAAPLTPCSGIPSSSSNTANHHRPSRPASAAPANSIAESSLDSRSPGHYVPPGRIRAAPEHAASSAPSPANTPVSTFTKNSRVETKTLNFSGGFYFHTEHKLACQPQAITRSVSHKTRMFGQSHWVNSIGLVTNLPGRGTPSTLRMWALTLSPAQ